MTDLVRTEVSRTLLDLAPIVLILGVFWAMFLRGRHALLRRALAGGVLLAVGLTLFRGGLDSVLLPLTGDLARGLAERLEQSPGWKEVLAVVGFAAAIGATAALIEPTMAATADRVSGLTGGAVRPIVLRVAVAVGFGAGLGLAGLRLVFGIPLGFVLAPMVAGMLVLVTVTPRRLVPLALDSGAIATSVVTVPMIAAYGVAVAETLPGRSALSDGFGSIALAMIGSALAVLAFAALDAALRRPPSVASDKHGERG